MLLASSSLDPHKVTGKNIPDLLSADSFQDLSEDDVETLIQSEEEYYRRGHFEKIYPLANNIDKYAKYYEALRYNNLLLWRWLKSKSSYLGTAYPQVYHTSA